MLIDDLIAEELRRAIRDVPDFPKPGIVFKDITPVLADPALFSRVTMTLASPFRDRGITHVVAVESRGFILGAPVAQHLGAALIPVRKPGKLPWETHSVDYLLEYGTDTLEMHTDAFKSGARVLVVDDVLATGGTAGATCRLVEALGAEVAGCAFMIVLSFLPGLTALSGRDVRALVEYGGAHIGPDGP
jgi:adenine phosphoribosyltransferase